MTYRFETFELDIDRFELRHQGAPRAIEPQVFALLRLLIENRHRMVPRDEIVGTIWSGRVVSEAALSSRVKSARQAIDDDGSAQRLIRTIHGRGFRFVGDVESAGAPPPSPAIEPAAAPAWSVVLARPSIAVLPFQHEGEAPEDAYFTDGLAEELIAELSSWRWFPVLSRDSSFDPRRAGQSAAARAVELGARYALTGRLRRAGAEARLSVELLDAATDTQLWSGHWDGDRARLSRLQSEIAGHVFQKITPELTSAETRRVLRQPAEVMSAWDLTLKGLWHLHRATAHDFSEALRLLDAATRVDAGFALPWSLIALVRFELALKGWTGPARGAIHEAFRDMLAAAHTAVDLDPSGWMGHALVSAGELWTHLSFGKARRHVDRALELNPSGSMAYHFSGCIHGFAGQLETAIATEQAVYRVDPAYGHTDVVEADLGLWRLLQGELEEAARHLDRSIAFNPTNVRARQRMVALAGVRGDQEAARAALVELERVGGKMNETYLAASYPFRDPGHAAIFRDGLRRAGLRLD